MRHGQSKVLAFGRKQLLRYNDYVSLQVVFVNKACLSGGLEMAMSFADIVKFGLAKEKNAEEFYRCWANCLRDPDKLWSRAKVLLLSLATEEQKHQEIFEKINAADLNLSGKKDDSELNVENYALGKNLPNDAKTKDVIETAIGREDSSIRFYGDLADLGGNMRGVFANLAEQEKKHKERLETFLKEHVLLALE